MARTFTDTPQPYYVEKAKIAEKVESIDENGALLLPKKAPEVVEIVGINASGKQVRIQIDSSAFEFDYNSETGIYILKNKTPSVEES